MLDGPNRRLASYEPYSPIATFVKAPTRSFYTKFEFNSLQQGVLDVRERTAHPSESRP